MKPFKLLAIVCSIILMCGCASLHPVSVNYHSPIDTYRYVYITPTSSLSSGTGSVYNGYGSSTTKSVNPGDIISGYLIKKGYIIVPQIQPEYASQTLIINYGVLVLKDHSIYFLYNLQLQILPYLHNNQLLLHLLPNQTNLK